jgi:predicted RNase H-like HicB family nuclease
MREAIELFLEGLVAHGDPIPKPRHAIQIEKIDLAIPA